MQKANTQTLQGFLDAWTNGDRDSQKRLVENAYGRLRLLASKLLSAYPGVGRWEETDDVLQQASVRLWKSLEEVKPSTVREFFGLAALQIRRTLLDLARHYYGAHGLGKNHLTDGEYQRIAAHPGPETGPVTLSQWTELHEKVEQLPDEQREIFTLHYYHGLTQAEVAKVLEMPLRTFKRRWRDTKRAIYDLLQGEAPDMESR